MQTTSDLRKYHWREMISPRTGLWNLELGEVWRYRDLVMLFVYRDFVTFYKQTILGPVWFVIQPVLSTVLYMFIFGRVAGLSTDGIPQVLFYLSGVTAWNYFAECVQKTSNTFTLNANMFGKVYFPRLIVPVSVVISNLMKLGIQLLLFIGVLVYYIIQKDYPVPVASLWMVPLLILMMATLGLGAGLTISSLTTRYRDLQFLVQFGIQLMMFVTPVVYPLSMIPEQHRWWLSLNPMTTVIEGFRYAFLGTGNLDALSVGYSVGVTILLLLTGLVVFQKVEKSFIDTV